MPVYNGARFVGDAIGSILSQSFTDFEFLILNDGSTDNSAEIMSSYNDPRIRLIDNEANIGLVASLNRGIEHASGIYIARMDADDVCLPDRLGSQAAFLDAHPEIGVCGTWYRSIGNPPLPPSRLPCSPEEIRCSLLFNAMMGHPTVMLRRHVLMSSGLRYQERDLQAEDYGLWVALSEFTLLANIDRILLEYRQHEQQVSCRRQESQSAGAGQIRRRLLASLGIEPSDHEFSIHQTLGSLHPGWCRQQGRANVTEFLQDADQWLTRIYSVNLTVKKYAPAVLSQVLLERWLILRYLAFRECRVLISPFLPSRLCSAPGIGISGLSRAALRKINQITRALG